MRSQHRLTINICSTIFLLAMLFLPLLSHAKMRSVNKIIAGTPPYEIVKKIAQTNSQATQKYLTKKKSYAPYITWLTDPDPRIQPQQILSDPIGDIYTCRNFGAQLQVAKGQVDYGIRHLHTPILLITVNSDNQAIEQFIAGYKDLSPSIRAELDHLHLPLRQDKIKGKEKKGLTDQLLKSIEANVDYQVEQAVNRYRDRIDMGRLTVVGTVLDFNNSYQKGKGRLIVINVNGETDKQKLRNLPAMRAIGPQASELMIGRERPTKKKKGGN